MTRLRWMMKCGITTAPRPSPAGGAAAALLVTFLFVIKATSTCSAFVIPHSATIVANANYCKRQNNIRTSCTFPTTAVSLSSPMTRMQQQNQQKGGGHVHVMQMLGKNDFEAGVEAAQCLLDPRRQDQLKSSLRKQFPLIPGGALDVCIDQAAIAMQAVAPSQLKAALKPGGMVKLRPQLESSIVDALLKQDLIKDIPLISSKDKKKLVYVVVNMAMDYLLQDVEDVLAAPEERLKKLDEQRKQVIQFMTPWQMTKYYIRYHMKTILITIGVLVLYSQRELFVKAYSYVATTFVLPVVKVIKSIFGFNFGKGRSVPRKRLPRTK